MRLAHNNIINRAMFSIMYGFIPCDCITQHIDGISHSSIYLSDQLRTSVELISAPGAITLTVPGTMMATHMLRIYLWQAICVHNYCLLDGRDIKSQSFFSKTYEYIYMYIYSYGLDII